MTDSRERLLATLTTVLESVPGLNTVKRNDLLASEGRLPALIILDGDEEASQAAEGRGRPGSSPNWVTLRPEMYLIIQEGPTVAGPVLNSLRKRIINHVLTSTTLAACCKDAQMRYEGCRTALALGRAMVGEMAIDFSFDVLVRPVVPEESSENSSAP